MSLLRSLLIIPMYIVLTGIDVLFFLTFLRIVSYRWHPRWLIALNSTGKPAVDWFTGYVEKGLRCFSRRTFPEKTMVFIGMLTLMFMRFFLVALFSE
jgi:hypothetical protein